MTDWATIEVIEHLGKGVEIVGVAIIVAIRTFLSLELELEIEGRWPWQRQRATPRRNSGRRIETARRHRVSSRPSGRLRWPKPARPGRQCT